MAGCKVDGGKCHEDFGRDIVEGLGRQTEVGLCELGGEAEHGAEAEARRDAVRQRLGR